SAAQPSPSPVRGRPGRARHPTVAPSLCLACDRVDGGSGDRAATPTAPDDEVLEAELVRRQRVLGLRRADEPDRDPEDRGRPRGAGLNQLEQPEQRGRSVADSNNRVRQMVAPEIDGRGAAGGFEPLCQLWNAWIAQGAD